jgi:hypothetical protein
MSAGESASPKAPNSYRASSSGGVVVERLDVLYYKFRVKLTSELPMPRQSSNTI